MPTKAEIETKLKHDIKIREYTNKTLEGILSRVRTHAAKLEEFILEDDLEGAKKYLAERTEGEDHD